MRFHTQRSGIGVGSFAIALLVLCFFSTPMRAWGGDMSEKDIITLPAPKTTGLISVEKAIVERRSLRSYEDGPLSLSEISQILWAGQGITHSGGYRASPSAGAIYPMSLYVLTEDGGHTYDPKPHILKRFGSEDKRRALAQAALGQSSIARAPMVVVIVADVEKSAGKYRDRAVRYCDIEAGHIGQNIALQAHAIGLGVVTIGAYDDEAVRKLLHISARMRVCCIIPIGRK
jgi:SagB-type dehydrogenase family enzyme